MRYSYGLTRMGESHGRITFQVAAAIQVRTTLQEILP
jgi:hypothetical protein